VVDWLFVFVFVCDFLAISPTDGELMRPRKLKCLGKKDASVHLKYKLQNVCSTNDKRKPTSLHDLFIQTVKVNNQKTFTDLGNYVKPASSFIEKSSKI
jgi:hypothetical protein